MSGVDLRLGRLFNKASGRSFIAAIDHGVTIGVPQGAEDALGTVARIIDLEPDAVLLGPGLLARGGDLFAFGGAPATIMRTDWIINDPRLTALGQGEAYREISSPRHAVELGADAVIMFLIMGVEQGSMFADNIRAIGRAAEEAYRLGMPLLVEATLWGSRISDRKDAELLAYASRTAAELGAAAIKTEWCGDRAEMTDIINGTPVPVVVLGGAKAPTPEPLLEATREAIAAGARGVAYGRNVWQADDPNAVARELRTIIHAVPGV